MDNDILTDRTPPHNNEAEKAVLGSLFINPDALPDAMEYLQPADFYRRAHQFIFQAMLDLSDDDQGIDAVTVTDKLKSQNQLDDVGGVAYIVELADSVPTAANLVYYAKIVAKKATLRRLIQTATKIASTSYDEDGDVETVLDNAERDIMNVTDNRNQSGFKAIKDVLAASFTKIDELSKKWWRRCDRSAHCTRF
nr:DnaB-like helicase N-terminal domain-containing protein [Fructilactobacillus florum]